MIGFLDDPGNLGPAYLMILSACLFVTRWCFVAKRLNRFFSERGTYVHVRYMLSAVRLSVVCLSVTLVHPTQPVEVFGNFFHRTIAQGL